MTYTQEEKAKMDALLQAFQSYVDRREDYDVLYSQKAGYLRLLTGESCDAIYFPITGFADMMRMFADDYLADEENRVGHCPKLDYDHVRHLLIPRLDTLGKHREEAYGIMEDAFDACRSRRAQFRQERLEQIHQLEELVCDLHASLSNSERSIGI